MDFFTSSDAQVLTTFVERDYDGEIRGDWKIHEYSSTR
jgi:hypothetical protein